jgi:hypothetical protein
MFIFDSLLRITSALPSILAVVLHERTAGYGGLDCCREG